MRPHFCRGLAASIVIAASGLVAQTPTPSPALLVLSKTDHALAIVDPSNMSVVAKVPVGNDPHEVAATDDGKTAYVTNYGGGAYNTISPVDLVAQKPLPVIDTGALYGPHGIMYRDGEVWFTAEAAKAIARYNPATNKIDWIMGSGQNRTHMIYAFPGGHEVITTNVSSGTMSIFDENATHRGEPRSGAPQGGLLPPTNDWQETVIPVGQEDEGFDVSPDGTQAWTASPADGSVAVVDIAAKKLIDTIQAGATGANRLKFTPDGRLVFISAGPKLVILNVATRKVLKTLDVGHGSDGVLIQPDGKRAFVACSPDNYVAVIDMDSLEISGHLEVGGNPDGMAWAVRKDSGQ
jgi:DNA-binding beta-propeller fold protein YncE